MYSDKIHSIGIKAAAELRSGHCWYQQTYCTVICEVIRKFSAVIVPPQHNHADRASEAAASAPLRT